MALYFIGWLSSAPGSEGLAATAALFGLLSFCLAILLVISHARRRELEEEIRGVRTSFTDLNGAMDALYRFLLEVEGRKKESGEVEKKMRECVEMVQNRLASQHTGSVAMWLGVIRAWHLQYEVLEDFRKQPPATRWWL